MAAIAWLAAAARALPPVPMCCSGYVDSPIPDVDGVAIEGSEIGEDADRFGSRPCGVKEWLARFSILDILGSCDPAS